MPPYVKEPDANPLLEFAEPAPGHVLSFHAVRYEDPENPGTNLWRVEALVEYLDTSGNPQKLGGKRKYRVSAKDLNVGNINSFIPPQIKNQLINKSGLEPKVP